MLSNATLHKGGTAQHGALADHPTSRPGPLVQPGSHPQVDLPATPARREGQTADAHPPQRPGSPHRQWHAQAVRGPAMARQRGLRASRGHDLPLGQAPHLTLAGLWCRMGYHG